MKEVIYRADELSDYRPLLLPAVGNITPREEPFPGYTPRLKRLHYMEMYFSPHNLLSSKKEPHINSSGQNVSRQGQWVKSLWRRLIYLSPLWIRGPLKRGKKSFRLSQCDTRSKFWQHHKQLNPYFSGPRREREGGRWEVSTSCWSDDIFSNSGLRAPMIRSRPLMESMISKTC